MQTILNYSLIFLFVGFSLSCSEKKPSKTITEYGELHVVTPIDFAEKSKNETIIDIRTQREFIGGHIEGAVNLDYYSKSFSTELNKLDKSKPLFIYCRSGSRSGSASRRIVSMGFKKVYDLQGGIINWARNKQKIVK